MGDGAIEVDSIEQIELADVTNKLARESGFLGVVDLLKTAKHGRGTNVYLVRFHYLARAGAPGDKARAPTAAAGSPRHEKTGSDRLRTRVARILVSLPEAVSVEQGSHLSLELKGKRFGYFLDDHHGDGRVAINCKATPDVRDALQQLAPNRFHVPKYVGKKGWVGLWLDGPGVDWSVVELALREAYALVAPKARVHSR